MITFTPAEFFAAITAATVLLCFGFARLGGTSFSHIDQTTKPSTTRKIQ